MSSGTTVYRFPYKDAQRSAEGEREVVISGIPTGGHSTRTLAFDSEGLLYVSVGSAGNVDTAPDEIELRSQIRRYELPENLPQGGIAYASAGEVSATGMRNEAGIFVDDQDRLANAPSSTVIRAASANTLSEGKASAQSGPTSRWLVIWARPMRSAATQRRCTRLLT